MAIPEGTKFHGVAASVDTINRGSSIANSNRDAYAIEDFGTPIRTIVDITPAQILSLGDSYIEIVPLREKGKPLSFFRHRLRWYLIVLHTILAVTIWVYLCIRLLLYHRT